MEAVLSLLKDGTHGTHQDAEEGPYLLSAKNIKNGQIIIDDSSDRKISEDEFNQIHTKFTLENGDILLTIVGSIGESAILESAGKFTFQRSVAFLRPSEEMTSRFLKTEIESVQFQKELNDRKSQSAQPGVYLGDLSKIPIYITSKEEQKKIGKYFSHLDNLITLHHRKYMKNIDLSLFAWEQRKLSDVVNIGSGMDYKHLGEGNIPVYGTGGYMCSVDKALSNDKDAIGIGRKGTIDKPYLLRAPFWTVDTLFYCIPKEDYDLDFTSCLFQNVDWKKKDESTGVPSLSKLIISNVETDTPTFDEQIKIGEYFSNLDHLITLHHRKQIYVLNTRIYAKTTLIITKEKKKMPELEKVIEDKLIEQLVFGESQWTYREDLKTEEDLWKNFRYILEQNNKARLDGQPLSDAEFEQVKNQLQFSSFYKAGEWLVGENGKAMVHVQRDTEKLHLVVMNHEHIAGGSSVYEVINQYNALKDDDITTVARDRRFDVTLMINGLPMIHIELKNRQHSYMDAFYQIKKYISEGKFTGIFFGCPDVCNQ